MRCPQLLVHESDGKLAAMLRPLADANKWLLREPRQLSTCLRLFGRGGPGVLVLRVGRQAEGELALLERVTWLYPEAAVVLVADNDPPWLPGMAWDLGAHWVLSPPHTRERLTEIVSTLMKHYQQETSLQGGRA